MARFSGLALSAPAVTNRPFLVSARLVPAPASAPLATLLLRWDGGSAALVGDDGGSYVAAFEVPEDRVYDFSAEWAEAGLRATAQTVVDVTGPPLLVLPTTPPTRVVDLDAGFDGRDPQFPNVSFRRDERYPLRLVAQEPGDVAQLEVEVGQARLSFDGGACAPDGGCLLSLPLWAPPLDAWTGEFGITVTASDALGNRTRLDGGVVRVTRFRWQRRLVPFGSRLGFGALSATAPDGSLLVSTPGGLLQLSREGLVTGVWTGVPALAPPVLSRSAPARAYGFSRAEDGGSRGVSVSLAAQGSAPDFWTDAFSIVTTLPSNVVLLEDEAGLEAAAVAVQAGPGGAAVIAVGNAAGQRAQSGPFPGAPAPENLVRLLARGTALTLADSKVVYRFNAGVSPPAVAPSNFGAISGLSGLEELTLSNDRSTRELVGFGVSGSVRRLFTAPLPPGPGPTASLEVPLPRPGFPATGLLHGGGRAFFSFTAQGKELLATSPIGGEDAGVVVSSPAEESFGAVLAASGRLYSAGLVSSSPLVAQLSQRARATLQTDWSATGAVPVLGLSLSCNPDTGATGLLTGFATDGSIVSVAVDFALDPADDWPMTFHDPRNTNNVSTDLRPFACP